MIQLFWCLLLLYFKIISSVEQVNESYGSESFSNRLDLSREHVVRLVITGCTMGIFHVVAGPDHLSALATLAVGSSWRAITLGVRWGLGHSAGLVAVAIIFISLKGELDLRTIGKYCDFLVGIFMVILGLYGILDSVRMYKERDKLKREADGKPSSAMHMSPKLSGKATNDWSVLDIEHHFDHDHKVICGISTNFHDPYTQRVISFLIGLLHGIAGPGGILGVLPAVEMRSWVASSIYLGTFIIMSTLSMGIFAALYGEITKRIGSQADSIELGLRVFSSFMSVGVGFVWLVLSAMGKLDEFFH